MDGEMREWRGAAVSAAALVMLAVLGGCKREAQPGPGAEAHREAVEDAGPPPGALPEGVTEEQAREGRRLYRQACVMCHGEAGEGTQLGPSLVDGEWRLAADGTFEGMLEVVRAGVQEPEEFPVPMVGAEEAGLTDEQARAVAAYAYSLSRRQ
jgi:mono/diheme cytochrome c family protein